MKAFQVMRDGVQVSDFYTPDLSGAPAENTFVKGFLIADAEALIPIKFDHWSV